MARLSIENLSRPPKRYRPDLCSDAPAIRVKFESKTQASNEDKLRLHSIKRLLKRPHILELPLTVKRLKRLSRRIESAASPASSRYMRKQRIRIAGHLWSMVAAYPHRVSAFTLIPRTWEVAGGCLNRSDPNVLLEQLRQALIREGAGAADGWLFASIHGEHEPNDDVFRPHVHGLAVGGMRAVVNGLRKRSNFQSARKGQAEKVYQRLRMTRQPLSDLPEPLTYTLQSFWPERPIFMNKEGKWERQNEKRRIEEPRHTEVLQWLDRWRLADTCLLMGIQVTRNGLGSTRQTYTNADDQ